MSVDYYVYAEVKNSEGQWELIPQKILNEIDNKWETPPVYWSGSRTFFSDACNKMLDIGSRIGKKDVSNNTLSNYWPNIDEIDDNIIVIQFSKMIAECSNGNHQYSGFVRKNDIADFENGEIDYIESLSGVEYDGLSGVAKMDYQYYQWENPYGWYRPFKSIIKNTESLLSMYRYVSYLHDVDTSDVRLLLFTSC